MQATLNRATEGVVAGPRLEQAHDLLSGSTSSPDQTETPGGETSERWGNI